MTTLGTKTLGEAPLGPFAISLNLSAGAGTTSNTTLGVTRFASANVVAGGQSDTTVGITRRLQIEPGDTTVSGVGASQLGVSTLGEPRNAVAGARADIRLRVTRALTASVAAGVESDTTLGVPRFISATVKAGAQSDTTLGIIRRATFDVDATATATVTVWRGVLPDHLFVSLAEADAVSIAAGDANGVSVSLGLRRSGQNPQP